MILLKIIIIFEFIPIKKNNKDMDEELIKKYADLISFRLLATNKHSDHEWLVKVIKDIIKKEKIN